MTLREILEKKEVSASVPCRVDLGGTLDISTFFLPLRHLQPATFNIALNMRTTATLSPWRDGYIRISSRGFESAEFEAVKAPFNHPMGLMFAVVRFFNGDGVHVQIDSSSPPRSALGGSSSAAVAMVAAFRAALGERVEPAESALLAHYIESSVAGVPCGLQDQLAAAYGGVNCWYWKMGNKGLSFTRERVVAGGNLILPSPPFNPVGNGVIGQDEDVYDMNGNILVAYCGVPHVSSDINRRWVNRFLSGEDRDKWEKIIKITHAFSSAVKNGDFNMAASLMNKETLIRLEMTPDVLDKTGRELFESAVKHGCGARFTGAGGGGCIWATGEQNKLERLRGDWQAIVAKGDGADILDTTIDFQGILLNS